MSDNGSDANDRLARMEEAITTMAAAVQAQAETTARGFETLMGMHRVLDARMGVLEAQMVEVIGRLRIIGEQLGNHLDHDHGSAA